MLSVQLWIFPLLPYLCPCSVGVWESRGATSGLGIVLPALSLTGDVWAHPQYSVPDLAAHTYTNQTADTNCDARLDKKRKHLIKSLYVLISYRAASSKLLSCSTG